MPTLEEAPPDLSTRAVVPTPVRTVVRVSALASALAVVVLGVVLRASDGPDAFDRAVTAPLRRTWPQPGPLSYAVDGLVTLGPILVTVLVLAAVCLLTRQRRLAVLALVAPFCVAAATTVVKPLVGRTIHGDNLSFPSGHTGYATAVGLVLGLLLVGLLRPGRTAWAALLLLGPALVAGGLMALDQVVLDAHYAGDTVGGFCTAVAVVASLALGTDWLAERWARRRSRLTG